MNVTDVRLCSTVKVFIVCLLVHYMNIVSNLLPFTGFQLLSVKARCSISEQRSVQYTVHVARGARPNYFLR